MTHPKYLLDYDNDVWTIDEDMETDVDPYYNGPDDAYHRFSYIVKRYSPVYELSVGAQIKTPSKNVGDEIEIRPVRGVLYAKVTQVLESSTGYTYVISAKVSGEIVE